MEEIIKTGTIIVMATHNAAIPPMVDCVTFMSNGLMSKMIVNHKRTYATDLT